MDRRESDRRRREDPHWLAVTLMNKAGALVLLAVGVSLLRGGAPEGIGEAIGGLNEAIGAGLIGAGSWGLSPSSRPFLSAIVERVPLLPSRRRGAAVAEDDEDDEPGRQELA